MGLKVTARNKMVLPNGFRDIIEKKCDRLMEHFRKVESIEVIMQEEKGRYRVEIIMQAGHFHGAALCDDMDLGAAFDHSLKRVEKQIARQVEKRKVARPRRGAAMKRSAREKAYRGED